MVNIVLADDHAAVRRCLKALLSSESDFKIVGEACNGLEALALVEKVLPDVLVLDLMMPGINGLEVTRRLCRENASTVIVMLSMHADRSYVEEALRLGAKGYVLKDSPPEELVQAIREASTGGSFISSRLSAVKTESYSAK